MPVQLFGAYQRDNARCAVAAVTLAGRHFLIGDTAVKTGLAQTTRLAGLRARFEIVRTDPVTIIDVAHNPDGIRSLVSSIRSFSNRKVVCIFGAMKDKDYPSMIRSLKIVKPVMLCVQPSTERAIDSRVLYEICVRNRLQSHNISSIPEAIDLSRKLAGKKGVVIITGSHYVVGEAISYINSKKNP